MAKLDKPIPNPFRAFNTMTYGVSLYLQSNKQYNKMMATGKKDVTGMELLIQSGGISTDPGSSGDNSLGPSRPASGNFGAKRNKFFTRDFYLDEIQLKSYVSGTATGGPQNSFGLNFTVTEPMGLTFIERLYNASTTYAEEVLKIKNFSPLNQIYLMVIRFYGYDKDGKQVLNGKFNDSSDSNSYIEKWIPFMIRKVNFKIESSKVVYACECVCPQSQIGQGQIHGTIPFNMGLQGATVEEILRGSTSKQTPGGLVAQGLMSALNAHQKQLVKNKKYKIANEYSIEFETDAGLDDAELAAVGTSVVARGAMPAGAVAGTTSKMSTGNASSASGGTQTQATNAGMKIVKFIDLVIRSSTYMSAQYKKISDANKDNSTKPKPGPSSPLNWFKIRPRIEILEFDEYRQAWAYKITYIVTVYPVSSVETNDFTSERCFQTHKEYDFWFTGKNTEVLDFRQEMSTMYYTTFSSKQLADPDANPAMQNNLRAQRVYRPNSTQAQTSENLADEQAANAASVLYSPKDLARAEIDIVGDPDWLSQSELFYAASPDTTDPILDDGSINYDIAEVFFSVNFNTVVDYNLDTGLADVTQQNVTDRFDGSNKSGVSQYSFVYRANTIISQFDKGKFTQRLSGTLVFVPASCIVGTGNAPGTGASDKSGSTNKVKTASAPLANTAETVTHKSSGGDGTRSSLRRLDGITIGGPGFPTGGN